MVGTEAASTIGGGVTALQLFLTISILILRSGMLGAEVCTVPTFSLI